MKVIAISGWKGSGKDTVGDILVKTKGFTRVAFADSMKDMVASEYKIPRHYLDDLKLKEAPLEQYPVIPRDDFGLNLAKMLYREFRTIEGYIPSDFYIDPSGAFLGVIGRNITQLYWTPRALCILKGSSNGAVTSDYWTQKVISTILSANSTYRMFGEYSLDNLDKFVITDLRYNSEVKQLRQAFGKDLILVRVNRFDSTYSTDSSERDLDNYKFDVVIDNKTTLEDLEQQVEKLVKGE